MPIHLPNTRFRPAPANVPTIEVSPKRDVGVCSDADDTSLTALSSLGVTHVRMSLYWNNALDIRLWAADRKSLVEREGKSVTQYFADDINRFLSAGLDPLIVVHSPPPGMTLDEGVDAMPDFMAQRAKALPGRTWEIMNEMNGSDSFNGGWFSAGDSAVSHAERGDRYARLLAPVHDAVKSADPTATIVTGGIDQGLADFYGAVNEGAHGKFDAFCIHSYGPPVAPGFIDKSKTLRPLLGDGANKVPLWCTEFGRDDADDAAQAADIGACLDANDADPLYDRIYIYSLIGDGNYGIVKPSGELRDAAKMLRTRVIV